MEETVEVKRRHGAFRSSGTCWYSEILSDDEPAFTASMRDIPNELVQLIESGIGRP